MSTPSPVVIFDVNETLSDMSSLGARFVEVGAPASFTQLWLASVLRDGFALTVAGECRSFADIGRDVLRTLLSSVSLNRSVEDAAELILAGIPDLIVHPDVVPGANQLREDGFRLGTLSNGASSVAERLLTTAGIRDLFEQVLSVEDAGVWKPAKPAYQYAADRLGVALEELTLVAVHPWDIDGAARAGLRTVWLNRTEGHYPSVFREPAHSVTSLEDLSECLDGKRRTAFP